VGNQFLFVAYGLVWIIFMLYAWNLSRRQIRLRRELEDLKKQVSSQPSGSRPQP
jgi:CcmD family protein